MDDTSPDSRESQQAAQASQAPKGTLTLLFRAQCACGIWKDVDPYGTDEFRPSLSEMCESDAKDSFEFSGWTNLDTDPTCARCSEVAALCHR